ncbi:flagellar basal body P-ring formation chaperone FlgA [Pleionea sp. CnH1-48]|uniref:flagellar basal body P-ring formation chaperone FlgA n=1 Tax=Pleionea sp. CnH1-48 TaxID=2954494 RepID=UPI0020986637|nr:flagellar basal body P-ring formation chaperone FlgA [Pleionea sp. CnH1-48]MCO7226164.1 flagellar basal body P-ring formation chaperone FlgA [Pleionea sp. CnH1-48]
MNIGNIFKLICVSVIATKSFAANLQSDTRKAIQNTANNFLLSQFDHTQSDVKVTLGKLDPRLRLPTCEQPLEAFMPKGSQLSGNSTVGIRCNGVKSWHIYLQARIDVFQPVVIFKRSLNKGDTISSQDLAFEKRNIKQFRKVPITNMKQLVGAQLKRRVIAGEIAEQKVACAICKGSHLTIEAQSPSMTVAMKGVALEDGYLGKIIAVRNLSSKKELTGTVVAGKKVIVKI